MLREVEPKNQAGGRYPSPAPPTHHPHAHIYTFSLCGEGWGVILHALVAKEPRACR